MKVADHKRREPFSYCEVISGKGVHLYVPVKFHQITLCRRVVLTAGFSGDPKKRTMCVKCTKKAG